MGNFRNDLDAGEAVEVEVAQRLRPWWGAHGYQPVLKEREKGHDIRLVHPILPTILVEVKYDRESENTGNIAIEYQCNHRWSGIATTEANFWVIKHYDRAGSYRGKSGWFYQAVTTKQLTAEWRSRRYQSVYGGDECRARLILVPVRALSTMGVRI